MSLNEWQARRKKKLHRPMVSRSKREDRTEDGIVFDSKSELMRYRELKKLQEQGFIEFFIRQPTFDLAGVTYKADFLIVWNRPAVPVTVEDVKAPHPEVLRRFRRNQKQVRELYGIEVEMVEP